MVLLRNENDTLPIRPAVKKIALVGYLGGDSGEQLGPHESRGRADEAVSIRAALEQEGKTRGLEVGFAEGCVRACTDDALFPDAVSLARDSDLVVAVLGEPREYSGEGASRADLKLWGRQGELLDALLATGKPVVLVVMAGRPLDISAYAGRTAATLMVWYPGTEAGPATADIIFGTASPSAKLPLTWPRSVGQLPLHYDALASGRPYQTDNRFTLKFVDLEAGPLYPFGFGLTYTRFSFSDVGTTTPVLGLDETAEVQATLRNDGPRAGTETVQLYIRDEFASQSRPVRQLKAIERVTLEPGESRTITLRVPVRDLGFTPESGTYRVEPGRFLYGVGSDSTVELTGAFEVSAVP
jgi:beta-glucosidase